MKAGRVTVKKMITDYEKTHIRKRKPPLKGGGDNSMTFPKEYTITGNVYRASFEPLTQASVKRHRRTTFSADTPRQVSKASLRSTNDADRCDSTDWEVSVPSVVPVVVLLMSLVLYLANAARTIITTYNVLPVTFNVSPSGFMAWIVFLWLIKRLRDFFDQTFALNVAVANKETQTEYPIQTLNYPIQAAGNPVSCTQDSSFESSSLALHKETQV
ncbi:uncharacterized protein LOC135478010 [Liolophura sinensis]|uniref:uncharacterized protein LOC135478010 n=1 Tax=Liolophura sinensis TaxID=3198878 RepID=UPI0031596F74